MKRALILATSLILIVGSVSGAEPKTDVKSSQGGANQGKPPFLGKWQGCTPGNGNTGFGVGYAFTESTFQFFWESQDDSLCSNLFAEVKQSGTYKILGKGVSEEGLPIYKIQFNTTMLSAPIFKYVAPINRISFNIIHVDKDELFLGSFSHASLGESLGEYGFNLFLNAPHVRVE